MSIAPETHADQSPSGQSPSDQWKFKKLNPVRLFIDLDPELGKEDTVVIVEDSAPLSLSSTQGLASRTDIDQSPATLSSTQSPAMHEPQSSEPLSRYGYELFGDGLRRAQI